MKFPVRTAILLAAIVPLFTLNGCTPETSHIEIAESVEPSLQDQTMPPELPTAERLGMTQRGAAQGTGADPHPPYEYALPPAWEELPPAQFRDVNLRIQGQPESEIYLTVLPGGGGGLAENINRWRRQMGLEPATPEEIAALPTKPLLGEQASYVTLEGNFSGMTGGPGKENFKLLGLAATTPEEGYFLKMTGPAAVVDSEAANFEAFAASLRKHTHGGGGAEHDHAHEEEGEPHDHEHAPAAEESSTPVETTAPAAAAAAPPAMLAEPGAPQGFLADGLQWDVPGGWQAAPDRPMRLVTFTVAGAENAECYVSSLSGAAGGVEANLNRWQQQMGLPALNADEIDALTQITVLGTETPLLKASGAFTGMDNVTLPDQMLLGIVVPVEGQTIFVKMTGPAEVVAGQEAHFISFCESLR